MEGWPDRDRAAIRMVLSRGSMRPRADIRGVCCGTASDGAAVTWLFRLAATKNQTVVPAPTMAKITTSQPSFRLPFSLVTMMLLRSEITLLLAEDDNRNLEFVKLADGTPVGAAKAPSVPPQHYCLNSCCLHMKSIFYANGFHGQTGKKPPFPSRRNRIGAKFPWLTVRTDEPSEPTESRPPEIATRKAF